MKRTEEVFDVNSNVRLELDGTCSQFVRIWMHRCSIDITNRIPDLIAALQQFQETGTFVKPPRWTVEKTVTTPPSYFVENKHEALGVRCSATYLKTRDAAQRIADILNEES